jgi:hypothetical protein
VIPEGRPPDPAPHPLIYWGDLSVTGNGDLPLATQLRVESIASDRSIALRRRLTASISWVCGQLFSSLFFSTSTEQISPDSIGPFTSFDPVGFAIFAFEIVHVRGGAKRVTMFGFSKQGR